MRSRTSRRYRNANSSGLSVSLTPLVDTALTLLVVFMVTAPIARQSISVDLPRSSSADSNSSDGMVEITLEIDRSERCAINKTIIKPDKVVDTIREQATLLLKSGKHMMIFMAVDRGASCGFAIELLAQIQKIEGVQSVAFDTKKV